MKPLLSIINKGRRPALGNRLGFTLVELLLVIVILGILGSIAVPMFIGQRTRAMHSEAKANLEALRLLEEQYYAENGEYAPDDKTTSGTIIGIANIQAYLPGFKPGDDSNLNFDYKINYTVLSNSTTGFIANAVGKGGSSVSGANFYVDQDNSRNF
jgi:prepilin-type N-terminal cleavage/methylation domain-containing protein